MVFAAAGVVVAAVAEDCVAPAVGCCFLCFFPVAAQKGSCTDSPHVAHTSAAVTLPASTVSVATGSADDDDGAVTANDSVSCFFFAPFGSSGAFFAVVAFLSVAFFSTVPFFAESATGGATTEAGGPAAAASAAGATSLSLSFLRDELRFSADGEAAASGGGGCLALTELLSSPVKAAAGETP